MKILFGKFGHEANTFANKLAEYDSYAASGTLTVGDDIVKHYTGTADYMGGMIQFASENNVELIPTISCLTAAPRLSTDCVNRMLKQITDVVEAHKDEVDGICLGLHGAGCCEFTDTLEAYVLEKVRDIVGPDMPITIPMDLHANICPEVIKMANGIFGIKHYPHVDMYDAGYLAMKVLVDIIRTNKKPNVAVRKMPLLIPLSAGYTFASPFTEIHKYFNDYKNENGLIDVTFFHSFPYADTVNTCASIVVVCNGDAQKHADALAKYIWEKRKSFVPEILSPHEALDRAVKIKKDGYIVINELSDNPGGGTPGDGTHLLRELLKCNYRKSIFGYIYDPIAVDFLQEHKVGDKVSFMLGGRTEPLHGEPLSIKEAEIICLSNGKVTYVSPVHKNVADTIGRCARVRVGNVDIVIGSVLHQTYDDRPFLVTGADINQYRYVCLKSAHHFRAFFREHAAEIIPTDPPGLQSGDFSLYNFKNIPRPIFPMDGDVEFKM